jgi:DNA-binding NtrC family response regulator
MSEINEKILIIDDDTAFGETLEILISDLDYKVSRSLTGNLGLELLSNEHPELVITDLKLPDLSGLEVLKRVKEFDQQIQVIIITAFDDMETTIEAMRLGAYDYLEKEAEEVEPGSGGCTGARRRFPGVLQTEP